jgi:hypothetical protein
MENPKASAAARLKEANNVLVTVSTNPSVDQLAGAIGLTLLLNKLGKHATAVFSGEIPSTIEFLQPEQTLESNTDSLRDFIIALDKSKADKLRYKVEETQVRIFITPYRTSLSQEDLEFSHGDFNVDVVVALGVHEQQDLDQAIVAHGRILHDATILTINTQPNGSLGSISWVNEQASSLCEMLTDIGAELKSDVLDAQMATALLTGIVAETERFSNQRTTSQTMSISAKLMAAGANQQLVATELQSHQDDVATETAQETVNLDEDSTEQTTENSDTPNEDGSLRISHDQTDEAEAETPEPEATNNEESEPADEEPEIPAEPDSQSPSRLITEPPSIGSPLTASALPEDAEPSADPLSLPPVSVPLLSHETPIAEPVPAEDYQLPQAPEPVMEPEEPVASESSAQPLPSLEDVLTQTGDAPAQDEPAVDGAPTAVDEQSTGSSNSGQTLADLEQAVESPHAKHEDVMLQEVSDSEHPDAAAATPDLDAARQAVSQAVAADPNPPLEPIQALGAQPVNLDLGHDEQPVAEAEQINNDYLDVTKIDEQTGLPAGDDPNNAPITNPAPSGGGVPPPPMMPPPMMPPHMAFGEQPLPNSENDNQAQDPIAPL